MTIKGGWEEDLPEREIEGFQFIPSRDRCLGKYGRFSLNHGHDSLSIMVGIQVPGTRYAVYAGTRYAVLVPWASADEMTSD